MKLKELAVELDLQVGYSGNSGTGGIQMGTSALFYIMACTEIHIIYSDRDKSWPICFTISQGKSGKTYRGHCIHTQLLYWGKYGNWAMWVYSSKKNFR